MAISRFLAWLQKTAPEESDDQRIAHLMRGLTSADRETRIGAQTVFKDIVYSEGADYSAGYTCAVLRALAQQGDLKEYPWILRHVEYLGQPLAGTRIDPEVSAAAAICIQRLKERYEPDYAARSLLHTPESGQTGDVLLRPAHGRAETQPETLLRADATESRSREGLR